MDTGEKAAMTRSYFTNGQRVHGEAINICQVQIEGGGRHAHGRTTAAEHHVENCVLTSVTGTIGERGSED